MGMLDAGAPRIPLAKQGLLNRRKKEQTPYFLSIAIFSRQARRPASPRRRSLYGSRHHNPDDPQRRRDQFSARKAENRDETQKQVGDQREQSARRIDSVLSIEKGSKQDGYLLILAPVKKLGRVPGQRLRVN